MGEAADLRKKLDDDLKALQERCQHLNSQWAVEWWAPGHSTGCDVRICINCEKVLEKRGGLILEEMQKKVPVLCSPTRPLKPVLPREEKVLDTYPDPPSQPEVK